MDFDEILCGIKHTLKRIYFECSADSLWILLWIIVSR